MRPRSRSFPHPLCERKSHSALAAAAELRSRSRAASQVVAGDRRAPQSPSACRSAMSRALAARSGLSATAAPAGSTSCLRTALWRLRRSAVGSSPSSSRSIARNSWYASSASVWRSPWYSASIKSFRGRSRYGSDNASARASLATVSWFPRSSSAARLLFHGGQAQLLQATCLRFRERGIRHVGQRGTAPEAESMLQTRHRKARIARGASCRAFGDQPFEAKGIEVVRIDRNCVSAEAGLDRLRPDRPPSCET